MYSGYKCLRDVGIHAKMGLTIPKG